MKTNLLSIIAFGIKGAAQFVVIFMIGATLSAGQLNIWLLIFVIYTIQSLIELGANPTAIRLLIQAKDTDREAVRSVITGHYRKILLISALYYMLASLYVGHTFGWSYTVLATYGVIAFAGLITLQASRYIAFLHAKHRVFEQKLIELSGGLVLVCLSGFVYLFDPQLPYFAAAFWGMNAFLFLGYKIVDRRFRSSAEKTPDDHLDAALSTQFKSEFRSQISASGLGTIFWNVLIQVPLLIAGNFVSLNDHNAMMFLSRFTQLMAMGFYAAFNAVIPNLNRLYVAQDMKAIVRQHGFMTAAIISGYLITATVMWGLFNLVQPEGLVIGAWLYCGYVGMFAVERLGGAFVQLQTLNGRVRWHIYNGTALMVFLVSLLILAPFIDNMVIRILVSQAVGYGVGIVILPTWFIRKEFGRSAVKMEFNVYTLALATWVLACAIIIFGIGQ